MIEPLWHKRPTWTAAGEEGGRGSPISERCVIAELQAVDLMRLIKIVRNTPRKRRDSMRTGMMKSGRHGTQRDRSCERPPPGTIMCTSGWWVIAEPHVCGAAASRLLATPQPERLLLREQETRKRSLINGPHGSLFDPEETSATSAYCDAAIRC